MNFIEINPVMLVSVIVPTYNRANLLGETIRSILNQSYKNLELIIVDDGSTDNTEEVIISFTDDRIIYIKTQNWGGPARPRNIGIKKAKGEYLAFSDDDDIWMENKLKIQIEKIKETNCFLLSSNVVYFTSDISNRIGQSKNRVIKNIKDFISQNQINTSSVIVRNTSDIIFPEDKNLIAIEDYTLWLDLYIKGRSFEFISSPLLFYRIGDHNITKENWYKNHLRLIYLYMILMLNYPYLRIKGILMKKVLVNIIKAFVKYNIIELRK